MAVDLAAILIAGTGALGSLGTAFAFIWNKVEARFKELERKVEECEQREKKALVEKAQQLTVIELLWQEVQHLAPNSEVLERAGRLLDSLRSAKEEPEHA